MDVLTYRCRETSKVMPLLYRAVVKSNAKVRKNFGLGNKNKENVIKAVK